MNSKSVTKGILSFLCILFMMPLGHAFVILMQTHLEAPALQWVAGCAGFAALVGAILGCRVKSEAMQVLCGAFCAVIVWGTWIEFSIISFGKSLEVPPLMVGGEIYTKPEYRLLPSTLPFAALFLLIYVYSAPPRWMFVKYMRRFLQMKGNYVADGSNESIWAFLSLLLLIWITYLVLLVEFNPSICGARHPVTMITAAACLSCGLILLLRSMAARSWASAFRQAIVTVCILWTFVEIMLKLKLFTEIWIYPQKYVGPMIALLIAFVATVVAVCFIAHRKRIK